MFLEVTYIDKFTIDKIAMPPEQIIALQGEGYKKSAMLDYLKNQ